MDLVLSGRGVVVGRCEFTSYNSRICGRAVVKGSFLFGSMCSGISSCGKYVEFVS